jgi:hypothetical protein
MFMSLLAMSLCGSGVTLGFFVFADGVVMLRLVMMVRGSVVVSGGQVMMLAGRVLLVLQCWLNNKR